MKRFKLHILSTMLTALFFLALQNAKATTFTAVASGDWTSTATWGGTAPDINATDVNVIIPVGINVTLDNHISISGSSSSLEVLGEVSAATNSSLTIIDGSLTGQGQLNIKELALEGSATVLLAGIINTDVFVNNVSNLSIISNLNVNHEIRLESGTFSLDLGGALLFGNDVTINFAGGDFVVNNGTLTIVAPYNVIYSHDANFVAGAELTSPNLKDLTIDISSGNTLTLSNNVFVNGTLTLESGTLDLNDYYFSVFGTIDASASSEIHSSAEANINLDLQTEPSGSLNFSSDGNHVNDFMINIADTGYIIISSALTVNGSLTFGGFGSIMISDSDLMVSHSDSISGYGHLAYVMTSGDGYFGAYVDAGASASAHFPVGTEFHYSPANIELNSGSSSGNVMVNVYGNVRVDGYSGISVSDHQSVVNATWYVSSDVSANLDMNLELFWNADMEVNNFNNSAAYVSHYTEGSWDVVATAEANVEADGMLSLKRENITSLSPFGVFDEDAAVSVSEVADFQFELFPNPSNGIVYIQGLDYQEEGYQISIYDAIGKRVENFTFDNNQIELDLSHLKSGIYFINIYNKNVKSVNKVTLF
ncbi:MAG: T9SS C-terminal target domain-containing protein [Chitinophagaceae bacterium]|nr:MAG: T9SS C-terminal target domain-containing protein [Chitinophagaceae bacterium]